jgi:DNA-binding NtrC family response regulator
MNQRMKSPAIILEGCDSLREALEIFFQLKKIRCETFATIEDTQKYVERTNVEPLAFFSNFYFPDSDPNEIRNLFSEIRAKWPSCPLVLATAANPKSPGVQWLRSCLGVRLVRKPYNLSELTAAYRDSVLSTPGNQMLTEDILRLGESQ